MYDDVDYDRDTYQVSYSIDTGSKECTFADDLECVILTTEITVVANDDDTNSLTRMSQENGMTPAQKTSIIEIAKALAAKDPAVAKQLEDLAAEPAANGSATGNSAQAAGKSGQEISGQALPAPSVRNPTANAAAQVTTEQPRVQSTEEYIASAPANIQAVLKSSLRMHEQHKGQLITALTATGRCKFNAEQLGAFDIEMLENLADLASVPTFEGVSSTFAANTDAAGGGERFNGMAPPMPKMFEPKVVESGRSVRRGENGRATAA